MDRLSVAQSVLPNPKRVSFGPKKNAKSASAAVSRDQSYEALNELPNDSQHQSHSGHNPNDAVIDVSRKNVRSSKQKRRAVASMIIDQVGDAISSLALKDSSFHRKGIGSVYSARVLARNVFSALSTTYPPRNLIVSGNRTAFSAHYYTILIPS